MVIKSFRKSLKKILKMILKNKFTQPLYQKLYIQLGEFKAKSGYHNNQIQKFEHMLLKHGYSINNFKKILEFGCGYGRLISSIQNLFPNAQCFGSDKVKSTLDIAKKNNLNINYIENSLNPPFPCEDEKFDLIYTFGVFTHLNEKSHIEWLEELSRKLKPGGICLHSIHTLECLKLMNRFSPESINKYAIPKPVDEFISSLKSYYYTDKNKQTLRFGLSIIPENYVRENWPKYSSLELIDVEIGAIQTYPEGCHDLVMLKKSI